MGYSRSRRCIVVLLAVILMIAVLPLSAMRANATQSKSENFSSNYVITGNGASDMVAIAAAQLGRSGSQLGYTENWCANFLVDCAKLAGQSAAIGSYGYCSGMYNAIIAAGGKVTTSSPKVGDICFINWDGGSSMNHVEIVSKVENGVIYTIGGNSGGESDFRKATVYQHSPLSSKYIVCIVRPAYVTVDVNYSGKCTTYSTDCRIRVTSDSMFMSQPCSSDVDAQSQSVTSASAGSEYLSDAIYKNTNGELWYRVSVNGKAAYLPAADTEFVEYNADVSISGVSAPDKLEEGDSFSVKGKIQSSTALSSVSAYAFSGDQIAAGTEVKVSDRSYSLQGSALDKALKFSRLEPGSYSYVICASIQGYYADGNRLASISDTVELYRGTFTVSKHACVFDEFCGYEAEHPHCAKYKCTGCGTVKTDSGKTTEFEECDVCNPYRPPVELPEDASLLDLTDPFELCFSPSISCCELNDDANT